MMSGTSLDGVDAVAVHFGSDGRLRVLGSSSLSFPEELRQQLLSLCFSGPDEINRSQLASNQLARVYADACNSLLEDLKLTPSQITAIGAHGQTVRHNPQKGATTQLINGALLAELTRIDKKRGAGKNIRIRLRARKYAFGRMDQREIRQEF